ncbi:MAG: heat shock protein HspQ [Gammaproteobacteria bacterium]|nr:heat shock protein HspQ [Gammaproteobacteria bacterium]MDD9897009.1 heat shock protein HspQ [Gammaproteobacteria bacterium]MDD9957809.1 heat shock protein HspQ [Gammaproteobacteria bacterium]
MGDVVNIARVKFSVGDVVSHLRFGYRGVIVDVDSRFQASDEWYDMVAKSRPPKNKPWYHVLVHGSDHSTYVAERHLELDDSNDPVKHPMLEHFFAGFIDGKYRRIERDN